MDREALRALLDDLRAGRIDVDAAMAKLRGLPFEDLGFAKIDHHRALRGGAPEAVFCPGKTPAQVVAILGRLIAHHANVLATRADRSVADAVAEAGLPHVYHPDAKLSCLSHRSRSLLLFSGQQSAVSDQRRQCECRKLTAES